MAKMIEELNEVPNINYLLEKVETVAKRQSLKPFEKILLNYYEERCFYCEKSLGKHTKMHVDHFIPWSFVQSDQIWNLVLSCKQCNLSKSDKLPKRELLVKVVDRNNDLLNRMESKETELLFKNYRDEKIKLLYEYSIKNGFDKIWVPK